MNDRSNKRPSLSRRGLLAGLAALPAWLPQGSARAAGAPAPEPAPTAAGAAGEGLAPDALKDRSGTRVVLLGTGGGPVPGRTRRMTSHAIVSDAGVYVVDCGLGVTDQLARAGIPFANVRSIFITHHHPDHNAEYGPLLLVGWVQGMPGSARAFGPPPLRQMTEDYLRSIKTTVDFWAEDFKMTPLRMIEVGEVAAAGEVMQDDHLKVTAAVVQHPPVRPALAYRFDFRDRSIVFSGDTAAVSAMAKLAADADVLVHEAMYVPAVEAYVRAQIARGRPVSFEAWMAHMNADHTPVEEVGRIAQDAGVKTLVLSHLTPALDSLGEDLWRDAAARHFKGRIIVARDLMVV